MKKSYFLVTLFFFAFIIRVAVFYGYLSHDENYWQVDSFTYHQVATQMARGKGIVNSDGSSHFYRVPGYSMFLAGCYKLFGQSKAAALWVQLFLASFIPLLMVLLSLSLFPDRWLLARIVGVVGAMHLGLTLYAGFFMTETLFIIFFLLFLLFFVQAKNLFVGVKSADFVVPRRGGMPPVPVFSDSLGPDYLKLYDTLSTDYYARQVLTKCDDAWQRTHHYLVLAGFFLGVASLIRPVGHYLIVVVALVLLLMRDLLSERLVRIAILGFTWFAVVSCWLARNYLLTWALFFHTLPGGHFLYLSAARVAMQVHGVDYPQARKMLEKQVRATINEREAQRGSQLPEIESCIIHEKLAWDYFCKRPLVALRYWMTDILRASLSLYSAELVYLESGRKQEQYFAKDRGFWPMFKRYLVPETDLWLLRLLIYAEMLFFALMLFGFFGFMITGFWRCSGYRDAVFNTLPFIMLFLVIALSGGYARMRLPIEPLLIILSCWWWLSNREIVGNEVQLNASLR